MIVPTRSTKLIMPRLKPGEKLIGFFYAMKFESRRAQILRGILFGLFVCVGYFVTHSWPIVIIGAILVGIISAILETGSPKTYCFGVTDLGLHRASVASVIPYIGKTASYSFYPYEDIVALQMSDSYISSAIALKLKDGENASYVISKAPGIDTATKEYLLSKYK